MNRRIIRYVVIGVLFFVIGLVHYLPATVATGWVADRTPLAFDGVTGTAFDGKAAYASLPGGGINNVSWQLHPWHLLLARVTADIQADTDLDHVTASVSRTFLGHNRIRDLQGEATIGWLARLGGYTFVPVSGRVDLNIESLNVDDAINISALAGRVNLTNTRYELLNPPVTLGQFQVALSSKDDNTIQARVADSQGPLALSGHVDLVDAQRYLLDVRLRARASASSRLKQLTTQLGKADADGGYHITERGRL